MMLDDAQPRPWAIALRSGVVAFVTAAAIACLAATARAQTACGQNAGPDLIIGDVSGPANYAAAGGFDALALGHALCNIGSQWAIFAANTNQHPVDGGALFRWKAVGGAGRFEQVGQSWLHHGFFALSENYCCTCTPTDGTHLGIGCSDPSTAARCGSQGGLGPKWQVNAATGQFAYPPANPSWSGSTARRIRVAIADLEPTAAPGAACYFGEKVVITPDEPVHGNDGNNGSWREVSALETGAGEWSFGLIGTTHREQYAIYAWQAVDPLVQIVEVQVPGEGTFLLGWKVTDLGNGRWHYEYALYNVNSDISARSFSVPVPLNVALFEPGFHDVDYHSGDGIGNVNQSGVDWSLAHVGGALSWASETFAQNPNANALRWATLYNFRFDADSPPAAGNVTIGLFKQVGSVTAAVDVPAGSGSPGAIVCAGDGLDSAVSTPCPCANTGALQHGCANSANSDGARLLSSGSTSPDTVVMTATGELASVLSVLLQGDGEIASGVLFGDGIRCAGGELKRLFTHNASGGTVVFPSGADPSISAQSAALGDAIAPGSTRIYQVYYRDPDLAFCASPPGNTWNVTNASRVVW